MFPQHLLKGGRKIKVNHFFGPYRLISLYLGQISDLANAILAIEGGGDDDGDDNNYDMAVSSPQSPPPSKKRFF